MELHRLLADPEVAGDLLVEPALDDEPEHVPLARGQRVEALADRRQLGPLLPRLAVVAKRPLDDVEQRLIAERLLQEVDGAGLDGPDARRDVGVTADEDDGDVASLLDEALLQLEAARAGQAQIEHDAGGAGRPREGPKTPGRGVTLPAPSGRPKEAATPAPTA